jgi:excisionase family DNA binding protein
MTEPYDDEEWVNPQYVADVLKVHITTVYRWVHTGKLPAIRICRNLMRIRKCHVRNLIEQSAVVPDVTPGPTGRPRLELLH